MRNVMGGRAKVAIKRRKAQVALALLAAAGYWVPPSPRRAELLNGLQKRSKVLIALLGVSMAVLLGRALFLATSPYVRLQAALMVSNTEPDSLDQLVRHAGTLTKLTANIESASLGDIQAALKETASLSERVAIDVGARQQAWTEIKGQIASDSTEYHEVRAQLAQIQRLQQEEVVRLKKMLEAAQRPTIWNDALTQVWAFALGVVSSLFASWIYIRWDSRSTRKSEVRRGAWSWLRWF